MKKELRAYYRSVRKNQSHLDPEVNQNLIKLVEKYSKIALYMSMKNEVSLESLINKLFSTKELYLPAIEGELVFHRFRRWSDLSTDQANILAPIRGEVIEINELDAIVMPCIAANMSGYRLGYGGGYFDRALAHYHGVKVGVLIEACLTNEAFQEEFDVPMDVLVTEKRIIEIKKKG